VILSGVRLDPAFLLGLQIEQLLALGCVGFGVVYGLRPLPRRWTAPVARRDALAAEPPRASEDTLAA
jgi:hypothetical protein